MRCPHDQTHIFHARHFEHLNWRCPKDRKGVLLDMPADAVRAGGKS
jgi:hypothetical protein